MAKQKRTDLAEYKYMGDDGGRWLFQRRSDGLCITVDKPVREINSATKAMSVACTVRGNRFNEDILDMVKK